MVLANDACIEREALQAVADEVFKARCRVTRFPLTDVEPSLATSLWQKAIRRGHCEWAIRAALYLHDLDPDYVWRRLRVIALEEVSVADLGLIAQVLAIAGKRALRAKIGERQVLMALTARLALSPKCCIPCDMASWLAPADGQAPASGVPSVAAQLTDGNLQTVLLAADAWRALAPQSLRIDGRWIVTGRRDPLRRDAWLEQIEAPAVLGFVVRKGHGTYALNTLSVPAWQLASMSATVQSIATTSPASEVRISGVPAYAYCMYSGPGREALRRFALAGGKIFDELHQTKDRVAIAGHLLFYLEGGWCAKRYAVAHGKAIEAASEVALLRRYGVKSDRIPRLKRALCLDLPRLNGLRREVMQRGRERQP